MTAAPAAPPVSASVTLEEMRVISYPSFTRVVIETATPVTHKVDGVEKGVMRVRVAGLTAAPRSEDLKDGFVESVKLGRVGTDAMLFVAFTGAVGELRASALNDPPRLVLDFMRPSESLPREGGQTAGPLRTIVHGGHDSGPASRAARRDIGRVFWRLACKDEINDMAKEYFAQY